MTPKRTDALVDFRFDLKRAVQLLKIETVRYPDPPRPRQRQAVEALRGAAVVSAVASFEVFLRGCLTEAVDALEALRAASKLRRVEQDFILSNDFEAVDAILREKGRGDRPTRHPDLKRIASAIGAGQFLGEGFARTDSNPRSETVTNLLSRFGVAKPFDKIAAAYSAITGNTGSALFLRSKLDEIIGRRNEVAHQGVALNLSRLQLGEYVDFLRDFSAAVDDVVVGEFKRKKALK